MRGADPELGVTIRAPDFLRRRKSARWIEVLHLGRTLGVEIGGVEERDAVNPALAGEQVLPEHVHGVAKG